MKQHIYRTLDRIMKRHLVLPGPRLACRQLRAVYATELARNELYCELEQALQVELDDAELGQVDTFGALADYALRRLASRP